MNHRSGLTVLSMLPALCLCGTFLLSSSLVYAEPDSPDSREESAKAAEADFPPPPPEMIDGELPPPPPEMFNGELPPPPPGHHGKKPPLASPANPPMMTPAPRPPLPACRPKDSFREFKPSISGGYRKEAIFQAIHAHADEIEGCFKIAYDKDPKFEGMIGVQWLLERKGTVMKAFVKESTVNDEAVEKCLIDSLMKWEFPRGQNSGLGQIKHWFVFKDGKYQKD